MNTLRFVLSFYLQLLYDNMLSTFKNAEFDIKMNLTSGSLKYFDFLDFNNECTAV